MEPTSGETFVQRVWLPTTVFVLVTAVVWRTLGSWGDVWAQVISTLLLTPLIWGLAIGKQRPPRPMRALAVGALTGLVTQLAFQTQEMLLVMFQAGAAQGHDRLANLELLADALMALGGLVLGAILGLVVAWLERAMARSSRLSAPTP